MLSTLNTGIIHTAGSSTLMHPPLVHSVNEFCALLRIGRTKAYEMMNAGEISFVLIGGRRKIPHAEVVAYLNRSIEQSKSNAANGGGPTP
jgi:excisionase family DNA binding protein